MMRLFRLKAVGFPSWTGNKAGFSVKEGKAPVGRASTTPPEGGAALASPAKAGAKMRLFRLKARGRISWRSDKADGTAWLSCPEADFRTNVRFSAKGGKGSLSYLKS